MLQFSAAYAIIFLNYVYVGVDHYVYEIKRWQIKSAYFKL